MKLTFIFIITSALDKKRNDFYLFNKKVYSTENVIIIIFIHVITSAPILTLDC
jgi:hypothetical protein